MLGTVIKVTKLIKIAYSCETIDHTTTVYNWVTRLRDESQIVEAEYMMVLEAIFESQEKIKRKSHRNLFV